MKRMRYRVTIKSESSDDGAEQPTYATWMKDVPCDIQPVTGGETYRGRQVEAKATHVISIRHLEGLKPTMKLTNAHTEQDYHIERIWDRNGREHIQDIQVSELVAV